MKKISLFIAAISLFTTTTQAHPTHNPTDVVKVKTTEMKIEKSKAETKEEVKEAVETKSETSPPPTTFTVPIFHTYLPTVASTPETKIK